MKRASTGLSLRQRGAITGYLFITPQTLGFLLFVLGPVAAVFVFSFQDRNLLLHTADPVGLANYVHMLHTDPFFPVVLRNSLIFTAGLVPLNVVLALTLALLLTRPLPGMVFFRALFFAPVVTSAVAWAIVWKLLLQSNQGINQYLAVLHIAGPNWLRSPGWAMASVIITRVLKTVGLNMVILMAALQTLPRELDEAANVDGANWFQRVMRITIPQLMPTIFLVVLITIVGSLQVFDTIVLMTNGGPFNATNVLIYYIWFQAFQAFHIGYASALAVVLFLIILVVTIAQWALRRRFSYNEQ